MPFGAWAENISGDMYTAPLEADTNHPAPTAGDGPYGRINIDTTDQEHIATTAYVKGAYNSAIAASNQLFGHINNIYDSVDTLNTNMQTITGDVLNMVDERLADVAVAEDVENLQNSLHELGTTISNKRVEIYTTWDNDNLTTDVAFKTVVPQQ